MPMFGRQHLRLPMMDWNSVTPRPEARHAPTTRSIDCPHCGTGLRVAARAINTHCTACHKHLLLEDVAVRGDSVRTSIITCGTILIEPSARFTGILQASEVVIAGRVLGTVIGTRRVEVTSTGKVAGTVATRDLDRHDGALIDGAVHLLHADNSITTTTVHHG